MKDSNMKEILDRYTEKKETDADVLKKLDRKVSAPAYRFAYIFGSVSSLVLGAGMSLIMTDIGSIVKVENPFEWGLVLGIIGLVAVSVTYPLFKGILTSGRKKYAESVLALGEKIMKGKEEA